MKQVYQNIQGLFGEFITRFSVNKKKNVMALCMLVIMTLMWIKLLCKNGPEVAEAASHLRNIDSKEQEKSPLKVSFIELPYVSGRNDVLTRDFFSANGWRDFFKKDSGNSENMNFNQDEFDNEIGGRIAKKLVLQAISTGLSPQAFINDKLLTKGDTLVAKDGSDNYEFKVIEIKENVVIVKCRDSEIELKLSQSVGMEN